MPELPEVQFVAQSLSQLVLNQKIKEVKVFYPKIINNSDTFVKTLINQKINQIKTYGKYLVFYLDQCVMVVHLRMEGRFAVFNTPQTAYTKHDHLVICLANGTELVYRDSRKFGRLWLMDFNYLTQDPFTRLAKEPWKINVNDFHQRIAKLNKNIKDVLLDQSIIAGIGNIYASEILYEAGIHPSKPARLLSLTDCENIIHYSRHILKEAVKAGGSTVDSFESIVGVSGNYQSQLKVYMKQNTPCPKCGNLIVKYQLSGRGTYYCLGCQKRKVIGITGGIASGKSSFSQILSEKGYYVIDADQIVKELYLEPKHLTYVNQLLNLDVNNQDKGLITQAIFTNSSLRQKLNQYLHPLVFAKIEKLINTSDKYFIIVQMPLLFETSYDQKVDLKVVIDTDLNNQLNRLMMRKNTNIKLAIEQINSQMSSEDKKLRADIVISNNETLKDLEKHAYDFIKKYL